MEAKEQFIEGLFIKESKHRFLCEVLINNKVEECYVPSSAKLNQYLKLNNKQVLLTNSKGKENRTKYSIFAVKYYNRYIILNLNIVNDILFQKIKQKDIGIYESLDNIQLERSIQGYKADLIDRGKEVTVIENKSIISTKKVTIFPNLYSERFIKQLTKLETLLAEGIKIHYNLVALSPILKEIIINDEQGVYKHLLLRCLDKGMIIHGLGIEYKKEGYIIRDNVKIKL